MSDKSTTQEPEVLTPEVVKSEALAMPDRARAISTIRNHDEYAQAGSLLVQIKTMGKRIADVFGPICDAAFKAHKAATQARKDADAPLLLAESHLKGLMRAWDEEQERIRQQAQREAELKAKREEEERILAEAQHAQDMGSSKEEVQEIISAPVVAPPVVVLKETPKVEGVSMKDNWTFKVTDPDKIPREYMLINEQAIRAVCKALKANTNIPGIQAYNDRQVAVRTK